MVWNVEGKRVLITGSTRGIGREAAIALARRGAEVVLVARDAARGQDALEAVRAASPKTLGSVLLADLSLVSATKQLAREVRERFDRLDVLVNNAGAIFGRREVTSEGFERTFATNHLSPFVLTTELLPLLKKSAPARIVTTSSSIHHSASMRFEDLQTTRYTSAAAYGRSKLANVLFTRELARRLEGTGVTANSLHPGVVASNFAQERAGIARWFYVLAGRFMKTSEQGSRTITHLVASPVVEGLSGRYFASERIARESRAARNDETARRLWDESERLVATIG